MTEYSVPGNVKEVLSRLPVKDQVVLRSYIAGLRDELKEYKARAEHPAQDDHAHFHGHERCTADHGHNHEHDTSEPVKSDKKGGHDHDHSHGHQHSGNHHHESHEKHDSHAHTHDHEMKEADEVPSWKKRALESGTDDPAAAPFGGSWNTESSMDATK